LNITGSDLIFNPVGAGSPEGYPGIKWQWNVNQSMRIYGNPTATPGSQSLSFERTPTTDSASYTFISENAINRSGHGNTLIRLYGPYYGYSETRLYTDSNEVGTFRTIGGNVSIQSGGGHIELDGNVTITGNLTSTSPLKITDGIETTNITANYFKGDGSELTGIGGGEKTIAIPCHAGYLGTGSAGSISNQAYYVETNNDGLMYYYKPVEFSVGTVIKSVTFKYQCSGGIGRVDFHRYDEPFDQWSILGNPLLTCDGTINEYTNSSVDVTIEDDYAYRLYTFSNTGSGDYHYCFRWEVTYEE